MQLQAVDIVAIVVAVVVGVAVVVPIITVAFGREISDTRAEMIRTILSSLVALLAAFVGARLD